MASVQFAEFLPEVLPNVAGCADVVAINAIRNSAIELLERSLAAREVQDVITVVAADLPLDVEAPSSSRLVQVLSVTANGLPVPADDQQNSSSMRYYQPTPTQLSLTPLPTQAIELVVTVAYAPTRKATGVEDWVYQRHLETVADGALARLYVLPGQPWSNPELAGFHAERFRTAAERLRADAMRAFVPASARINPRRFGY